MFKFRTLCVFEPPFGGLGTTYDVHLGLIGKHVVDFLLVLIEVFLLGVTAESLRAKRSKIDDFARTLAIYFGETTNAALSVAILYKFL